MSGPADLAIVGGGAAGFFAARVLEELRPASSIVILEKTRVVLRKVSISGGGRCNVTHAEFEPRAFAKAYPRGGRELIGPLSRFGSRETMAWFERQGVQLKTEDDGRVFPKSDDAQSIVDCLRSTRAELRSGAALEELSFVEDGFLLRCSDDSRLSARRVLIAAGGSPRASHYDALATLGHGIEAPVPSLFAFHVHGADLEALAGVSVPDAVLRLEDGPVERGSLLLTHRGLSGPAVLKLSAVAARELARRNHRFTVHLCWDGGWNPEELDADLRERGRSDGRRLLAQHPPTPLPRRIWERLIRLAQIPPERRSAELTRDERRRLVECCCDLRVRIEGQSPNKDEFVTCGGVRLREVDFRTMESRMVPGLYFAGEILDIDAVTGGYNFQAAWTTGWIAAQAIAAELD